MARFRVTYQGLVRDFVTNVGVAAEEKQERSGDEKMACGDLFLFCESLERGVEETPFVIYGKGDQDLLVRERRFGEAERPL